MYYAEEFDGKSLKLRDYYREYDSNYTYWIRH
jgi:hypothetical protein